MSLSVGIDISKSKLDIFYNNKHNSIENNSSSIKSYFSKVNQSAQIVMEATGKYHHLAHCTLEEMGFSVMIVNPYQSRYFARSLNIRCKTDKVDANTLCLYGERMEFKKTPAMTGVELELQGLSRHLDDLKNTQTSLMHRKENSTIFIADSLQVVVDSVKREIKATTLKIDNIIKSTQMLKEKAEILETIPGVGRLSAIILLCLMRELGTLKKTEVAALSGLAPFNNESGKFTGKRHIRGGRHDVRSHLYMPVLGAATRHNPRLQEFYNRLIAKGKPPKVALTACMRKLVVWANAMLSNMTPWNGSHEAENLINSV